MTYSLGSRIRDARLEAGFSTQEKFARALDVSLVTVNRWEGDRHDPSVRMVARIAALTGKPLSFFFTEVAA